MSKILKSHVLRRDFIIFFAVLILVNFGNGLNTGTINNFAVDTLKMKPEQIGIYESIRESPGIIAVFVISLLMGLREPMVAGMSILLMSVGLGLYTFIGSWYSLLVLAFAGSLGLHCWFPISSAISLHLAREDQKGNMLGMSQLASNIGVLVAMVSVLLISQLVAEHKPYRLLFAISGCVLAAGGLLIFFMSKKVGVVERPKLVFRRKYWLYYVLTFLEGCRKQIFITFAIFVLVRAYNMSIRETSILFIINALFSIVAGPPIGRLIDRLGEKRVVLTSYILVVFVFIGYATVHNRYWLSAFYIVDNILYLGSMGLTTFVSKKATVEDLRPTLSMGVTMNHVAAVAMPIIGGLLWQFIGYEPVFILGAGVVVISILFVLRIPLKSLRTEPVTESETTAI